MRTHLFHDIAKVSKCIPNKDVVVVEMALPGAGRSINIGHEDLRHGPRHPLPELIRCAQNDVLPHDVLSGGGC